MDTVEGFRDAARRARECVVIGQAVSLARWIGSGRRPVTPGGVLLSAMRMEGTAYPVEYWDEERPRKPTPFGLNKVNRRLAALGRGLA